MNIPISLRALGIPESGIRRIYNRAAGLPDVISFTLGAPDAETPPHVCEAAMQAIRDGFTHYTPNAGLPEFREAVAIKLARENGLTVDPNASVMATVGAMGGLALAMQVLLGEGDEALIADPGYPSHVAQVLLAGGKPVAVPTTEAEGFVLAPERVAERITSRTRVLILNSPANPTGAVLDRRALEKLAELAQRHDLVVVSDEVYEHFVYDGHAHVSIATLPGMAERVVSVFSCSKSYAMTGWRIGYAVGPAPVIAQMVKLQEHVAAHPSSISQKAAVAALTGPQDCVQRLVGEFAQRRRLLRERLPQVFGSASMVGAGAFYAFVNIRRLQMDSRTAAMRFLEEARVAMVPGVEFGAAGEGYLRLSYCAPRERIEEGLRRMARLLGATQ